MNVYEITIVQAGEEVCSGCCQGASACEALENAILVGLVAQPENDYPYTAYVENLKISTVFRFECSFVP